MGQFSGERGGCDFAVWELISALISAEAATEG